MRQHLISVEKQTGRRMPALDSVVIPDGFESIFAVYWQLQAADKIKYSEIEAYCKLHRINLLEWELDALLAMDGETQKYISAKMKVSD